MEILEELIESAGLVLVSAVKMTEKLRIVDILTNTRSPIRSLDNFRQQVVRALDEIDTVNVDIDTTIDDGMDVFEADVLKFVRDRIIRIIGNQQGERFGAERYKVVVIDRILLDDYVSRVIKHFENIDDGIFIDRYSLDRHRLNTLGEVFFLDKQPSTRFIKLAVKTFDARMVDAAKTITYVVSYYTRRDLRPTVQTYTIPNPTFFPNITQPQN